jgi:hypothetical protein
MALVSFAARLFGVVARGLRRVAARLRGARPDDRPSESEGVPEHWLKYVRERAPHLLRPGAMPPVRATPPHPMGPGPGSPSWPAPESRHAVETPTGPKPAPRDTDISYPQSDGEPVPANTSAVRQQPAAGNADSSQRQPDYGPEPRTGSAMSQQTPPKHVEPSSEPARGSRRGWLKRPATASTAKQRIDPGTLLPIGTQLPSRSDATARERTGRSEITSPPPAWPGAFGPARFREPTWTSARHLPLPEPAFEDVIRSQAPDHEHPRAPHVQPPPASTDQYGPPLAPWPALPVPDRDDFDWVAATQAADDERRLRHEQRSL